MRSMMQQAIHTSAPGMQTAGGSRLPVLPRGLHPRSSADPSKHMLGCAGLASQNGGPARTSYAARIQSDNSSPHFSWLLTPSAALLSAGIRPFPTFRAKGKFRPPENLRPPGTAFRQWCDDWQRQPAARCKAGQALDTPTGLCAACVRSWEAPSPLQSHTSGRLLQATWDD